MTSSYKNWKQLFVFCVGLAMGTAFCMKWMESDFWVKGEKFTMLGLELSYPREKVISILSNLDDRVRTVLSYHLHFDFAFMAGIFPGISALCMMAREKVYSSRLKKILFIMAAIQLLAWAGDITENLYLIKWLEHPVIGNEFGLYHTIVSAKWIIALSGFLFSSFLFLSHIKTKNK
ncbi:MAG: hypothetical protein ACHQFX_10680 [Chitinophagales bacterium]